MEKNIFEYATRAKLRFPSKAGDITTEDLWDLPLLSEKGLCLDAVAKAVNAELKQSQEESFVAPTKTVGAAELTLKLEIVKHIIQIKLDEAAKAKKSAENKKARERITQLIAEKQDAELKELSLDQLQEMYGTLE